MIAKRLAELVDLPQALPFESPSSWSTRAALSQGVSLSVFLNYVGVPAADDHDLQFALLHPTPLSDEMGLLGNLEISRKVLGTLIDSGCDVRRFLLSGRKKSFYRFCPYCLADSPTPYFPHHWRFTSWRTCPVHDCLMEDACGHCGKAVHLPFTMMRAGRHKRGIADLGACQHCGSLLRKMHAVALAQAREVGFTEWDFALLRNGRAVLATLFHGELKVAGNGRIRPASHLGMLDRCGLLPTRANPPSAADVRELIIKGLLAQTAALGPMTTKKECN